MDEIADMIDAAGDLFAVLAVLAVTVVGFWLGRKWLQRGSGGWDEKTHGTKADRYFDVNDEDVPF